MLGMIAAADRQPINRQRTGTKYVSEAASAFAALLIRLQFAGKGLGRPPGFFWSRASAALTHGDRGGSSSRITRQRFQVRTASHTVPDACRAPGTVKITASSSARR